MCFFFLLYIKKKHFKQVGEMPESPATSQTELQHTQMSHGLWQDVGPENVLANQPRCGNALARAAGAAT